jgi:hypothetical protein
MIIPGQFGFNYPSGFREEKFVIQMDEHRVHAGFASFIQTVDEQSLDCPLQHFYSLCRSELPIFPPPVHKTNLT